MNDERYAQLRQLDPAELWGLQRVPANIYDKMGQIVLKKGSPLTGQAMVRMREQKAGNIFVGPEWNEAREVLAKRGPGSSASETADVTSDGKIWRQRLAIEIEEPGIEVEARRGEATGCALSEDGFGFFFGHYLHAGTLIRATLEDGAGLQGVVANCVYVRNGKHRVFVRLRSGTRLTPKSRGN